MSVFIQKITQKFQFFVEKMVIFYQNFWEKSGTKSRVFGKPGTGTATPGTGTETGTAKKPGIYRDPGPGLGLSSATQTPQNAKNRFFPLKIR